MVTTDRKLQKLLLRVSEAAEMLSVARSRAYLLVQTGELSSVKVGKSIRVPVAGVEQFVARKIAEAAEAK